MFDSIISKISKIKKNNDLKDLKDSGYLSSDEYSIMKDLAMVGVKGANRTIMGGFVKDPFFNVEYFVRGTDVELQRSLVDFWANKTDSADFFAERYASNEFRFSKKLSSFKSEVSSSVDFKSEGSSSVDKPIINMSKKIPLSTKQWGFKITSQFMSSIKKIDRKLQGRIFEAITHLTYNPINTRGDTIKPLTGDLEGYWRYRIGDYRLIYKPVEKWSEILLISFAARGSAYK